MRQQVAAVPIPLDGIGLGATGIRSMEYGYTRNPRHVNIGGKSPLPKVLKGLGKLFQKFPK